jgi:hypothetical protein
MLSNAWVAVKEFVHILHSSIVINATIVDDWSTVRPHFVHEQHNMAYAGGVDGKP